MRLGHIDRFSIVLMPMCDIVSLKTDSRSNWPVAALMESSSILPCSSGMSQTLAVGRVTAQTFVLARIITITITITITSITLRYLLDTLWYLLNTAQINRCHTAPDTLYISNRS